MNMTGIESLVYKTQVLAMCSGNNHVDFFEGVTTCIVVIDDQVSSVSIWVDQIVVLVFYFEMLCSNIL